jgi:spermidine synthase
LKINQRNVLLFSVFIVAASGLVYELIAGAVSSYLLGDAVTQFSLVIGVFLSAMGIGSYFAQFVQKDLLFWFVKLELLIALIGGVSSILIFATSAFLNSIFMVVFYSLCASIGALVGAEIPLLIRILKEEETVEQALSNVLALDYLGALAGSILFPFVVLPWIGVSRASIVFGLLNLMVAWLGAKLLPTHLFHRLKIDFIMVSIVLVGVFFSSNRLVHFFEDILYQDEIIYAKDTKYQRIILTRWNDDIRLYLNGHIQFSSIDEFRYHESLVHPAMAAMIEPPKEILVLGGGDGLVVRELLKYDSVTKIDLVDIDPTITQLAKERPELRSLNKNSLFSDRLSIVHHDAMMFLQESTQFYDLVVVDLPDPNTEALSKLYSTVFYSLVYRRLSDDGIMVTQATSPFFANKAFWCIVQTMETAFSEQVIKGAVYPYHVNVPSFGEWGFVLAAKRTKKWDDIEITVETRFLTTERIPSLFVFGRDIERVESESNQLLHPILYHYYRKGWSRFN